MVWWQINALAVGPDSVLLGIVVFSVLLGIVVFEDEFFATQGVEPMYCMFAVMISNMFAIIFNLYI